MKNPSKEQVKRWNKTYYEKNKKKRRNQYNKHRDSIRKWYQEYKSSLKCERCQESHPATLQFHHTGSDKELSISEAVARAWSISKIEKEISKCIVLCANCHFKEHYNGFVA